MPKISSIHSGVSTEHRLVTETDRQGHGVIASKHASSVARIKIGRNQANCVCNNLTSNVIIYNTFGDRSFAVAGPRVWNSLPGHLRDEDITYSSFRRELKTY